MQISKCDQCLLIYISPQTSGETDVYIQISACQQYSIKTFLQLHFCLQSLIS